MQFLRTRMIQMALFRRACFTASLAYALRPMPAARDHRERAGHLYLSQLHELGCPSINLPPWDNNRGHVTMGNNHEFKLKKKTNLQNAEKLHKISVLFQPTVPLGMMDCMSLLFSLGQLRRSFSDPCWGGREPPVLPQFPVFTHSKGLSASFKDPLGSLSLSRL